MKQALVLGAGRSSIYLVSYLLDWAAASGGKIQVVDVNLEWAQMRVGDHPNGEALSFNALDADARQPYMEQADVVISMLPAHLHYDIVTHAVALGKDVLTPSYLSKAVKDLDAEAKARGVLVLNELGVDPGIDHMSAMQFLDRKRAEGAEILGFESFTGGLVAPESDNNPWNYKFTWNPRNVVLAGQGGTVKFLQEGTYKYIPPHKLFRRTEVIDIPNHGRFEGYANRDSLSYRETYGLHNVKTIFRGTLRRKGFCKAWDVFVQLGLTDDSYPMEGSENMSYRDFINSFLAYNPHDSVELKLKHYVNLRQDDDDILEKLESLDIYSAEKKIGIPNATPAQALQVILSDSWALEPEDKDMIVMWHKINYKLGSEEKEMQSAMVCKGENRDRTAMAKTVGLPLGIAARLVLERRLDLTGVHIPIQPEFYNPILKELETHGITFSEWEK